MLEKQKQHIVYAHSFSSALSPNDDNPQKIDERTSLPIFVARQIDVDEFMNLTSEGREAIRKVVKVRLSVRNGDLTTTEGYGELNKIYNSDIFDNEKVLQISQSMTKRFPFPTDAR